MPIDSWHITLIFGLSVFMGLLWALSGVRLECHSPVLLQWYVGGLKYSHHPQIVGSSKLNALYYWGNTWVVDAEINWVKTIYYTKEMLTERSTYPCSANNFSLVNGISEGTSKFLVWAWRVTAESQLLKTRRCLRPPLQGKKSRKRWKGTCANLSLQVHWFEKSLWFLGWEEAITWLNGSVWSMKSAFPKGPLVIGHSLCKNVSHFPRDLFCVCRNDCGSWSLVASCLFTLHFHLVILGLLDDFSP